MDEPAPRRRSARLAAVDSKYECDAPKFFDFTKENDKVDDNWFNKPSKALPSKVLPTRSAKALTIPSEFNLSKPRKGRVEKKQPVVESKRVISKVAKKTTAKKTATKPKPFNLSTSLKGLGNDITKKSPYKPLAERLGEFDKVTLKSKTRASKLKEFHLTHPKSPLLQTKFRSKKSHVLSREEQEKLIMDSIEPFKAKPANDKILKADKPIGVPKPKHLQLTVPSSPAIVKPKAKQQPEPEPEHLFKANPVKLPAEPFVPVVQHKHTDPLDVKLPGDLIREVKLGKFEKQLQQETEHEILARQFKARPLPNLEPEIMDHREIHTTEPTPFHLLTDERGERSKLVFEEKLAHQIQLQKQAAEFTARPAPKAEPFYASKSNKEPTEPLNIVLASELRAAERKEFDLQVAERERLEEAARQEALKAAKAMELEQIKELREKTVHRAQPVRKFAPVLVGPSDKELTEAQSPMIGKKRQRQFNE